MQELDGALWTLKLKNAHSGAYRRSSTLSDLPDVDVSPAASSRSSRTSPRRQATSPPTSVSPLRHAPPFAASRNLASPADDQRKKDSHWMRSFNSDVRVHPVLEELPPHAGPDDWGRSPSPSGSAWPARPPTEAYEPPSPPSTVRMQAQHALELGVMRDRLEFVRAVLSGGQEGLEGDLARSREAARELEMLREDVLQMAEREGRALTLDEERLLEKIEWLEHLNAARLDPSAEQEELARTLEEEERLANELQRELAALGVPAHGAGDWEGWSRDEEERSGGSRPSTRQDKVSILGAARARTSSSSATFVGPPARSRGRSIEPWQHATSPSSARQPHEQVLLQLVGASPVPSLASRRPSDSFARPA
ncbi:hypothetical protein DMC30DRAFT_77746 [Rhodotorula diobovata]|uniref:Uncharacterized protein n=1 Tax=Rhodotorula diobovata TaxID=5288 RepID=A0A5C5G528_9BASI|nr:hypothetical protein DMC30DRAFT_77746 [Rhodotorula diobovata]